MITKIPQQMLRLEGQYNQPAVVIRDHKMQASQVSDIAQTEVVAGRFDANSGTLVLTLFDGTQKTIEGFPTESKIPVGPTGPSGKNGEDGIPGQKGRNGMPGAPGCDGPIGLVGIMGLRGDEGRPGQQGPVGPEGAQGDIGQQGMPGNTGPRGHTGSKGQIGDKGPRGRMGPAAPEQILNIVVSTSEPQNKVHGMLWVNPEADYDCGFEPREPLPQAPPSAPEPTLPQYPDPEPEPEPEPEPANPVVANPTTQSCGTTINGTAGYNSITHSLGAASGRTVIEYSTSVPGGLEENKFDVYIGDTLVASNGEFEWIERGEEELIEFQYNPATHTSRQARIVVSSNSGTASTWQYKLHCPGTYVEPIEKPAPKPDPDPKPTRVNPTPQPCSAFIESGAGYNETTHNLGGTAGVVRITYATVVPGGTAPNGIYAYLGNKLVASTGGYIIVERGREEYIEFDYDPDDQTEKAVRVVVTSPLADASGEWWQYQIACPTPGTITELPYKTPGTKEAFFSGNLVCSEDSPHWNAVPETPYLDKRRIVEAYRKHPWNHGRCPEHNINGWDGWTSWQNMLKTTSIDDVLSQINSSDVPESVQLGIVRTICEQAAIEAYGAGGFASFEYVPFSGNRCRVTF